MFTGIVQAVGRIVATRSAGDGLRVVVDAGTLGVDEVAVGDSVAVAGCCLTVVAKQEATLEFDVSGETLRCTAGLDRAGKVNLEKALRLSDRLGGHLLTGHVDGVGTVSAMTSLAPPGSGQAVSGSVRLEIDAPAALARFIAPKGSIAVDGVSLTVNGGAGTRFDLNLIPHTLAVTTLGALAPGGHVNLEVDLIARYVARYRESGGP